MRKLARTYARSLHPSLRWLCLRAWNDLTALVSLTSCAKGLLSMRIWLPTGYQRSEAQWPMTNSLPEPDV
jgi:hypothetical protein